MTKPTTATPNRGELPGFGVPIGVNDRNGRPIKIGSVLKFDDAEWGSRTGGPVFQVRIEKGKIEHPGTTADLSNWCSIIASCCEVGCGSPAEFGIQGDSGNPDDTTQACRAHVGALLSSPVWLDRENESWTVFILDDTTHQPTGETP